MASDPKTVTGRRRSDPTLDPRAFAGLFGALARGGLEFVTESIRVGGNVIGDLGDLVADRADRAADGVSEQVDRRFDSMAPTTAATRRTSRSMRVGVAEVVNRAVDGCVDVLESSARTFENVYNRQRNFESGSRAASASGASSDEPIRGYDGLTAEQVVARVESMSAADSVREVLDYEEQHKDRKTVVTAAQSRLTSLLASASATAATTTTTAGAG